MSSPGSIVIVTDQHLSANPRVWKEADALARNGYEVEIITRANNAMRKKKDMAILQKLHPSVRYSPVVNAIKAEIPALRDIYYRSRLKLVLLAKRLGFESRYLLSTDPDKIYTESLSRNADLYIAHVECGLFVGKHLIQKGKKVAFDFEDWYSRDYLSPVRAVKLLSSLELHALQHGVYVTCPSVAMADALKQTYNVADKPEALYNGFADSPVQEVANLRDDSMVNMVWFSQRVGPGRGLEKIAAVLKEVNTKVKLTLIGDCPPEYEATLNDVFPKEHKLELVPPVSHTELDNMLQQFDIGLALEEIYPESRNKTITNKILQYLQAGIKVLATNTDGQVEVAGCFPSSVRTVRTNDTTGWAAELDALIAEPVEREKIKEVYHKHFSWAAQEVKLLSLVEKALKN
ncbi:MAG: glycosyltransferase [Chitinophagaceae bacterium]|nr:glycosyltransferase [Chitinophagaceae bacterium]MCB9046919.1 glycosyltransferase [Chitinophagales bacterium]